MSYSEIGDSQLRREAVNMEFVELVVLVAVTRQRLAKKQQPEKS
jgi:hypothetical protein